MGGGPAANGGRPTANFYHAVLMSGTFTNHKFRVGLHVTFGLNDIHVALVKPG